VGQTIDLVRPSLINLAKKVTLSPNSDLFDALLPLLHGTKSDFLFFPREVLPPPTAKLAKSSETIFRETV
jgi:hypothetical protein